MFFLFIYHLLNTLPLIVIGSFLAFLIVRGVKKRLTNYDYLETEKPFENIDEEMVKTFDENRVVLKGTLKRPRDYNDIQSMTKYNKNTYRDEKGRYASLNKDKTNE